MEFQAVDQQIQSHLLLLILHKEVWRGGSS